MNYYEARQKEDGKLWHFTCKNGKRVWPVGYCTDDPGHGTREAANECYRQYQMDNRLQLYNIDSAQRKCQAVIEVNNLGETTRLCDIWTQKYSTVDHVVYVLCDKHRTKEVVNKMHKPPHKIMASW